MSRSSILSPKRRDTHRSHGTTRHNYWTKNGMPYSTKTAMSAAKHAPAAVLFCQFASFLIVGCYKSKSVGHQGFAVFHATLGHFHDVFSNYLAHDTRISGPG